MTRDICLNAVPYRVTEQDGQVIFECRSGFYGTFTRFTFEWMGCGWYLVDFEDWVGRVFAPHIVSAIEWINENYGIVWTDGVGEVRIKEIAE